MIHSESLVKFAPALVAAQAELRGIGKDATNPDFRSRYASLDHMIDTVRPILAAHGLAVLQSGGAGDSDKTLVVETRLIHDSGEWIAGTVVVPLVGRMLKGGGRAEPDPQSGGSAMSYGRRYGLGALLCLSTGEDDDGNAASKQPVARAQRPAKAETPAKPAEDASTHRPPPKWLGLAGDRPMPFGNTKGKPLGEHSKDHLEKLAKWCASRPDFADFLKDVRRVLADMSLGRPTVSESSDTTMAKVHAEIERDEAPLTALLEGKR